jgi:hypothetical protein
LLCDRKRKFAPEVIMSSAEKRPVDPESEEVCHGFRLLFLKAMWFVCVCAANQICALPPSPDCQVLLCTFLRACHFIISNNTVLALIINVQGVAKRARTESESAPRKLRIAVVCSSNQVGADLWNMHFILAVQVFDFKKARKRSFAPPILITYPHGLNDGIATPATAHKRITAHRKSPVLAHQPSQC